MNRRIASSSRSKPTIQRRTSPVYPFTAIVGQQEMRLALLLNTIDPTIGGVLVMGHRGTGKSTAVRALADLLPSIRRVIDCPFGCDPKERASLCDDCAARLSSEGRLKSAVAAVPVVDLPLGATEDRVCGTINIERALIEGVRAFEPGLLARANRGFLYIDEVNLLEDHLVDLLLDVAVTGRNLVEREGISVEHPSRFVLVGSGNPEEGELRPQLLDRFGLHVEVRTVDDLDQRVEIVERRASFERDPEGFRLSAQAEQERLRLRLGRARKRFAEVKLARPLLRRIAELCLRLRIDGHRGELTITRAARALAAYEGRREVSEADVRRVALMALSHRMRRDPLEQSTGNARIQDALDQLFPTRPDEENPAQTVDETGEGDAGTQEDEEERVGRSGSGGSKKGRGGGATGNGADGTRDDDDDGATRNVSPSTGVPSPEIPLDQSSFAQPKPSTQSSASRGQRNSGQSAYNTRRGRYARSALDSRGGSKIALDATLRAAALNAGSIARKSPDTGDRFSKAAAGPKPWLLIDAATLRYKRFKQKRGTLFIFAIDASGSMALNRIGQAKSALAHLLRQSYVRRDRVALVSFRGRRADILLPPCRSVARAKHILDALPVGGATPLAAGLARSIEIAGRAAREGTQSVVLLIFTDGRANVALSADETFDRMMRRRVIEEELKGSGAALRRAGVRTIVVDTQNRFVSGGEARALAATLGGRHVALSSNTTGNGSQYSELALQRT
ncbi:MAG TPA: magnesium chelatase ATPase subunit I [Pyrinomonadaceae bacterium]|jgi:magnesium chelatase subunit D|nr:magnesium chelatase ATPase subunit I [Pyrinomonadaceae bacterium]